jgi:hypothetical protein
VTIADLPSGDRSDAGTVRIRRRPSAIRLADLRRHVQVVEQTPVLFHASIEDNVDTPAPMDGGRSQPPSQGAGIASFVDALPDGRRTLSATAAPAPSAGNGGESRSHAFLTTMCSCSTTERHRPAADGCWSTRATAGCAADDILISHRLDLVRAATTSSFSTMRIVERRTPDEPGAGTRNHALRQLGGRDPDQTKSKHGSAHVAWPS